MNQKEIFKVIAAIVLIAIVSGCGEGNSETNGTLTLSSEATVDTAAKTVTMTASAILTPGQVGSEISFTTQLFDGSGAIPLPPESTCSGTRPTDPTGTATISCNFPQPQVNATLQVSATSGGLAAIPVTKPIAGQ